MSTTRSSTRRRTNPTEQPEEVDKPTGVGPAPASIRRRDPTDDSQAEEATADVENPAPRVSERRRRPPDKFLPDASGETASKRRRKPTEESQEEKQAVGAEKLSELTSKPAEESREEKQEDVSIGKAGEAEKSTEVAPVRVSERRRKPTEKAEEVVSGEKESGVEESKETAPVRTSERHRKPSEKSQEDLSGGKTAEIDKPIEKHENESSRKTRKVEKLEEEKTGNDQVEEEEEDGSSRKTRKVDELSERRSKKKNDKFPPVVVFAHGAGAPSTSDWMIRWRNLLTKAFHAVEVVTFDYPYISGGRKAPPKAEKLVEFHSEVVKKAAAKYPEHPLILVGKSMGSRISCMVASEDGICASAVVCLGYPLKGMNGSLRDETLLQLAVPIMFVQGSNDAFCPLELLESVRKKMKVVNALHVIDGGDHSFQIGKKHLELTGSTHGQAEEQAVEAVAKFLSRIYGER